MSVETEALQNIRHEIATNIAARERPESLQDELLDELCAVDRQLGGMALFVMSRDYYRDPPHYPVEEQTPVLFVQEKRLF